MHRLAAFLAAGLVVLAPLALACGDKLVPVGGGVRMERIARSEHPGTVFVLISSAPGGRRTADDLVAGLARTGHNARLVSRDQLESASREAAPDVVMALPNEAPALLSSYADRANAPVIVSVVYQPNRTSLEAARRANGCVAEVPDWGVSPAVRFVNGIRAAQDSGRPVECARSAHTSS